VGKENIDPNSEERLNIPRTGDWIAQAFRDWHKDYLQMVDRYHSETGKFFFYCVIIKLY